MLSIDLYSVNCFVFVFLVMKVCVCLVFWFCFVCFDFVNCVVCILFFVVRMQLFWPVVAFVIQDNPEGQALAGVYGHANAKFPCRMCMCPSDKFDDPPSGFLAPLRKWEESQRIVRLANLERTKAAKKRILQPHSREFVAVVLWPFLIS